MIKILKHNLLTCKCDALNYYYFIWLEGERNRIKSYRRENQEEEYIKGTASTSVLCVCVCVCVYVFVSESTSKCFFKKSKCVFSTWMQSIDSTDWFYCKFYYICSSLNASNFFLMTIKIRNKN